VAGTAGREQRRLIADIRGAGRRHPLGKEFAMMVVDSSHAGQRGERRTSPRYGVEFWVEETAEQGQYFHRVTNLSLGGFFIEKKIPFPVGQEVALRMELPGAAQKLQVTGRIVNNYQDQNDKLRGAGIQFMELDEQVREGIATYLNKVGASPPVH
jgi:uncharacterized protein (TIGR02266 family)